MNKYCLLSLFILAGSVLSANAVKRNRKHHTPEQTAFCDKYLAPVLELKKAEGIDPALDLLETNYQIAETTFSNTYFFRSAIWWEAQTQGGELDQEWGVALYNYILEREREKDPNLTTRIPWRHYLLIGNIIAKYNDLGRAAQARTVAMELENNMRTRRGLDTTCTSYTDIAPVFPTLTEARKRQFPVYEHELPNRFREPIEKTKKDYINYAYIYGINYVADSTKQIGDWPRAAELYAWVIAYTDEYAKEDNFRRVEVIRHARDCYVNLADILILHGCLKEAVEILEEYIEKSGDFYKTNDVNLYHAKLKRSTIRLLLEALTEEDLTIALKAEKLHWGNTYSDRDTKLDTTLARIRIQHALGQTVVAWNDLNEFLADAQNDPNPHTQMLGINAGIDLALTEGGQKFELEEWLVRALDYERSMGNKFNELPLYEKYAAFLMIHGRFDEAELIQTEAARLASAMNLPKRLKQNQVVLKTMIGLRTKKAAGNPTPESAPTTDISNKETTENAERAKTQTRSVLAGTSASAPQVDLQPRRSLSAALKNQPAHGRTYLYNPSTRPETGTFRLSGNLDGLTWETENWLTALSHPEMEPVVFEKEITLQPASSCIIDVIGQPLADGTGAEITYSWTAVNGETVSSHWIYQTGSTGKRTAVIDAHELLSNPFYLIPLYHTVQRTDSTAAESVDFAMQASVPTRIESYNASGDLLSVDANGDGDFEDPGDFIAIDNNRNSWPDISFEAGRPVTSLIMYIKPLDNNAADSEIAVKLLRNGEWQTDAVDELIAR